MLITLLPLQALAEAGGNYNYEDLSRDKAKIINEKTPVVPAKLKEGQTAKDLIKNPDQPDIYTLRYDFEVPVENGHKPSYQPYIASVGANATPEEKAKVKKTIEMPTIAGFTPPDDEEDFTVNYQDIVDEAKQGTKKQDQVNGDKYTAYNDFKYKPVQKTIKVKHVFQDINDFSKYDKRAEDSEIVIREQTGSTDSALQVQPLQDNEIRGFVPEESSITVQLPLDTDGYVVEYRYNRAHYEVTFDTVGGTPVQTREFFYGQTIPALGDNELPTKDGYKLIGWTATPTLKDINGKEYNVGNLIPNLSAGLIMPAEPVKFSAVWTPDSSAKAKTPDTNTSYKVILDYDNRKTNSKKEYTIANGEKLSKPRDPYRNGYNFMGWAWVDKNQDGKVLYSFNNPVTSDIKLKAIWIKNDRVDLDIYHYFLDKNGNIDNSKYPNPKKESLYDKRVGDYSTTVGDKISEKYTLASPEEIRASQSDEIKEAFEKYNAKNRSDNSYFQTIMVKEDNSNGNNEFYFFYKPFKQREYTVNYIDERGKVEVEKLLKGLDLIDASGLTGADLLEANQANKEKFDSKKTELDAILKKYQLVEPEAVTNGNRHYDARNYRQIPGWKLTSDSQQQLLFDLNENANEFLGINGTGGDQIFFYYKDVRVIDVKNPKEEVPEGYVRVTFKADDGGSFGKDDKGNDIKQINYDVIKGLYSQFIPVPQELKEGETKEADKYYITPDNGRSFKEWADSPLLNDNVTIEQDYTFTAKFDWSGLTAKPMVITEAFKNANGNWNNDFAPTLDDLKKQIVWMEDDQEKPLPTDAKVTFEGITKNEDIYEKLKELGVADSDQVFRIVTFKAKVEFKDNINTKEIEIPVKVYKNRYEALTSGDKPLPLSEAEKLEAKDGGLKDILSDTAEKRYVKVTVNPSNKPDNKDSKIYYVNPKAWVDIPEIILTAEDKAKLKFLNWTSDDVTKNDNGQANGVYDFAKRFKFTKDTVISPVTAEDVVEQKGADKPNVPDSFVKVIFKTTDKATEEIEKIFWVDSTKEVEITVAEPTGKTDQEIDIPKLGKKKVNYIFKEWQKVQTGETDESLTKVDPAVKINLAKNKYTDKVTVVEAAYYDKFAATPIVKPIKIDKLDTPEGKEITDKDLIDKITPPENKEIESITVVERPDPSKPGKQEAKLTIKYKDGSTQGTNDNPVIIPIEVHKNIIPTYDGEKPEDALENYVKITFKAGEGGSITDSNKKAYFVSPEVEVDMTSIAEAITKTPKTGYVNGDWDTNETKKLKDTFKKGTVFTFNFTKTKDIVAKTNDNVEKPKGYAELIFQTDGNGKLDNDKDKIIYYVNPTAGIKIVNGTAGENQIAVPTPKANANYEFDNWYEELDTTNTIAADKTYVACFNLINVTLTYEANGGTGQGPSSKTVKYGTKEFLANQEKLTKDNYNFIGWKLSTDNTGKIYQPGDDIILKENTTAIAQWKIIQHKVIFDTKGGSHIESQEVDHGSTATKPENPTKAGFVFMGWKENENDQDYYNFNTKITADKTLVAIWEKAVQKINENDEVGEEFIKVKFEQGEHGTLEGDTLYKVGKDLSFEEAVKYGLVVPTIKPNEYYKANGWDKELKLEGKDITFIAQYELENNVIPIKPEKTDEQIENEKPEGMIVVDFKVDPARAYLIGPSKFYVKRSELVNIKAPLVVKTDLSYNFQAWELNTEDETNKVSFDSDRTIEEGIQAKPNIEIRVPRPGNNFIELKELTDGAEGHLIVFSGNDIYEFISVEKIKKVRQGRKFKEEKVIGFDLTEQNIVIKRGDRINYYSTIDNLQSEIRELTIK